MNLEQRAGAAWKQACYGLWSNGLRNLVWAFPRDRRGRRSPIVTLLVIRKWKHCASSQAKGMGTPRVNMK